MKVLLMILLAAASGTAVASEVDRLAAALEPKVIEFRRHLHQNPELGNREFKTAKYVADHLRRLGLEVQTGVAHTGVVAVLRGALPGPVVALRADMDALPVTEETGLPFASKVRTTYDGQEVGVMHACGHDAHTGILMGVAELLTRLRPQLAGTVKFIFQPAEEGAPTGEDGGAMLMLKQGVFSKDPKPEVVFGLHVMSPWAAGEIRYRSGGAMASSDDMTITVQGKQTHGAAPWQGVDPIVTASQIVLALQTIASRQMNVTQAPVIVTVGRIEGGVRNNIIPDQVTLRGTLRTLDPVMREDLHRRVRRTVEQTAAAAGASATVEIGTSTSYPVTYNNPALLQRMLPTLRAVAGEAQVAEVPPLMGAEDFSFFAQEVPGLYLFLGARPPEQPVAQAAANHSPRFVVDERTLQLGVRTLSQLTLDYLQGPPQTSPAPAR